MLKYQVSRSYSLIHVWSINSNYETLHRLFQVETKGHLCDDSSTPSARISRCSRWAGPEHPESDGRWCSALLRRYDLFPVDGGCGAGLHPQQLSDWPTATLVEIQACHPLHIPHTWLVEPCELFHPGRFSFCSLMTETGGSPLCLHLELPWRQLPWILKDDSHEKRGLGWAFLGWQV